MKKLSIFEPQIEKHYAFKKNMWVLGCMVTMLQGVEHWA